MVEIIRPGRRGRTEGRGVSRRKRFMNRPASQPSTQPVGRSCRIATPASFCFHQAEGCTLKIISPGLPLVLFHQGMIANRNSVQLDDTVPLMQVSNGLKKTKPKLQYQMGHDKNLQDITLGSDSAIPRRGESAAARPTPPHGVWIRKMGLFWVSSEVTRNPPISPASTACQARGLCCPACHLLGHLTLR